MNPQVIEVAVPTPVRQTYDYLCPDPAVKPAMRVRIPFGRREVTGVVVSVKPPAYRSTHTLKPILELLDNAPIFTESVWQLLLWMSQYYHHPIGEVLQTAIPVYLRKDKRWEMPTIVPNIPHDKTQFLAEVPLLLNTHQQEAVTSALSNTLRFQPFLLDGVTGSGKTEVYLQIITEIIASGKQALILIPEIALTPQTIARFSQRFNTVVGSFHSGMTDKQRFQGWNHAHSGVAKIIIGTRSALFTPMRYPGVIIVDEEHDASYKQQDGLRYHARDAALYRAQLENIPIILGSATPSLESFYNVERERYQILKLPVRAGSAQLPTLQLIDMRKQPLQQGVATATLTAIKQHLANNNQVLIFLNRRGLAQMLMCHQCGYCAKCQRCNAYYTLHHTPARLWCHFCGGQHHLPKQCPDCGHQSFVDIGVGTEKLEQYLQTQFEVPIIRIDSDSTRRKGSLENLLTQVHQGGAQILLGTQMLAKGHHFPHVTLVSILDCDGGLFSADFRATERMGQLICQVAGRSGRSQTQGQVLIQTHHPDHPLLKILLEKGYHPFLREILTQRQLAQLPPLSYAALLKAEALQTQFPHHFLLAIRDCLDQRKISGLLILGPVPALRERIAGKFRAQLLFLAPKRSIIAAAISAALEYIKLHPDRKVRWGIDVDPLEF